ncbi:MAG: hypothetical protein IPP07_25130 [Holophagales bacterium]|nr:hypothetical protein [Holophagales bacterium]
MEELSRRPLTLFLLSGFAPEWRASLLLSFSPCAYVVEVTEYAVRRGSAVLFLSSRGLTPGLRVLPVDDVNRLDARLSY